MREHADELVATGQEEAELARANSLPKAFSFIQATEQATLDLEVERMKRRLAELTKALGDQLAIVQAETQDRTEKHAWGEEAAPGFERCLWPMGEGMAS